MCFYRGAGPTKGRVFFNQGKVLLFVFTFCFRRAAPAKGRLYFSGELWVFCSVFEEETTRFAACIRRRIKHIYVFEASGSYFLEE